MQWTDHAIVLSARKQGEHSAVIRVLSPSHGVYAGVMRGVHSKRHRGTIAPGNMVSATWQARLPEQLGLFVCELLEPAAALIMDDAAKLLALSSACAMVEATLPERHPYARLFTFFHAFLGTLKEQDDWAQAYVQLELELLSETGFGLDLTACAASGTTQDLLYVSPRSGRAVSQQAGEPYKDKLLTLPAFLQAGNRRNYVDNADILEGLQLTGYFLNHWLLTPHKQALPTARSQLMALLAQDLTGLTI
jgi:DNA repair protein RecO (recombination protein O)